MYIKLGYGMNQASLNDSSYCFKRLPDPPNNDLVDDVTISTHPISEIHVSNDDVTGKHSSTM